MSRQQIAVGWLREYKDRKTGEQREYISASANGSQQSVELFVKDENGNTHKLDSFAVYFNPEGKNPKAPHVTFVANLEE